jgi:uncharacterized membrane protein
LIDHIGNIPYQGIFALLILAGVVLIITGWKSTVPEQIYNPIISLQLPARLLVILGFILMAAANFPTTRIKRFIRNPQLSGLLLWAIAHLLLNGDNCSVIAFSSIGIWCIVSIMTINKREGEWKKPDVVMRIGKERLIPIMGVVLSVVVAYFHQYLSGKSLL